VKTIFRLIGLALTISGWTLAALSVYVIRTPNPNNPRESKLIVIPKARLGIVDTYVDARNWKLSDAADHPALMWRVIDAGKADDLKYLSDPNSNEDMQTQLSDVLTGDRPRSYRRSPATGASADWSAFSHQAYQAGIFPADLDLSKMIDLPVSF
jgi:hypothetical protein